MGVAPPDHRGSGWGVVAAIEVAAEDRQGPHGVPQPMFKQGIPERKVF